ncbi:MAG TPA: TetR/AcrR family transcriptional regulator [Candidatus Dormibacteraeota bacterium]|nr:TetR/AcrR family transcriptional regulator [Candidatus Dormibacteraeota bacterium]
MATRPLKKSERTAKRIMDAARRLFNERGASAVSTNHIAAAAGISPGNLYYHFEDKQAIIRALHSEYAAAHEERWEPAADARENLARLGQNVADGIELAWDYRFFEREILVLLRADPKLRVSYREVYQRRLGEWLAFGKQLVAQGLVRLPRPPRTLRDLAVAIWLVAESWLPFLDVTGDPQDPRQVAKGTDLIMVVLEPYLTAKGRSLMESSPSVVRRTKEG